jgi:Zn-dependent protease
MSPAIARHHRPGWTRTLLWRGHVGLWAQHSVELNLHLAWLLTHLVVLWLLGALLLPRLFHGWHPGAYWLVAVSVALTDGVAGLIHELGHAVAAVAKGKRVYRITLYGWAASVRRSSGQLRPRDQLAIALAGPLSHLLLGAVLWTAWQWLPLDNEPLRVAAGFPALSNIAVGMLNLLPFHPLDGSRVLRALLGLILRV